MTSIPNLTNIASTTTASTLLERIKNNGDSIDTIWMVLTAYIILTMQSGFGLLESGMVSRKTEANVMVKNMLDVVLGGASFWFIGYGFAFGSKSNSFVGQNQFLTNADVLTDCYVYRNYLSQLAFATTASTIVSGAVADRVNLKAYMIFAFLFTGFIYPIPAHWIWDSNGWLYQLGAYDFAGCSVVHISGGTAALVACIMTGPRLNRFGNDQDLYFMASPTNVILGTFFLWWGWLGFNCGSTFAMTGGVWKIAVRAGINTMNGAIGGGLLTVVVSAFLQNRRGYLLDIPQFSIGILGGLVAITSIASSCEPWEAMFIGFVGGFLSNISNVLINKMKIDDPVGVIGVHFSTGFWGMIAVGLFGKTDPVVGLLKRNGLFHGGGWNLLGCNVAASILVTLWSGITSAILVLVMKFTIGFRMSPDKEIRGADDVEHNIKDALVIFEQSHAFGKRIMLPKVDEIERKITIDRQIELERSDILNIYK